MRLATLMIDGSPKAYVALGNGAMLDLAVASRCLSEPAADALKTGDMQTIIEAGADALGLIRDLLGEAENGSFADAIHYADGATFLAPLPAPRKNVFCVGRNYAEHIAEGDRAQNQSVGVTEHPVFFTKPRTAVIGPGASVPIFKHVSTSIDYEVELALVIGKAGRDIPKERAFEHIFGYTILNDVSARDIQRRHGGQYFKGKSLDGSCPLGPSIVTADEIDPRSLGISLMVNGELRQKSTTAAMIFDIPTLIASLSEGLTLEPGDIVATGTPSGVGYAMTPPQFLQHGDIVVCEIEGLGRLENPVRAA